MRAHRIATVIFCDAHRTAKIAYFGGPEVFPLTHVCIISREKSQGLMHFSDFKAQLFSKP